MYKVYRENKNTWKNYGQHHLKLVESIFYKIFCGAFMNRNLNMHL